MATTTNTTTNTTMNSDKKEIYSYEAPWMIYGMNWSVRPDRKYRLALGSFIEDYNNKVEIIELNEDTGKFNVTGSFLHPYPTTKIMWIPDRTGSNQDLLATTGDYLRLWKIDSDNNIKMNALLNNNKNSEFCAPLTSFDWNTTDPSIIGTSSIDTTCFGIDSRILTNKGFLFYEEIVKQLKDIQNNQDNIPLLYACYELNGNLVYRTGKLVNYPNKTGKLINFTTKTESNQLSIRVTGDHLMHCQIGNKATGNESGIINYPNKYSKITAKSLLRPNCECVQGEFNCSNCQMEVRLVSIAANGVIHNRINGDNQPELSEELLLNLGITGDNQINSFLELYGYWLGAGSMNYQETDNDNSPAVGFGKTNSINMEFIESRLNTIGLIEYTDYYICTDESGLLCLNVINPKWCNYFNSEYSTITSGKWFWWWVLRRCSGSELKLIIQGLYRSDVINSVNNTIYTSSIQFRDELMIALFHAGYSAEFKLQNNNRNNDPIIAGDDYCWRISYTAMTDGDVDSSADFCYPSISAQEITEESYSGLLWCVEVDHPEHLIIAQRAETTEINGNTIVSKSSRPIVIGNCTIWNIETQQASTQLIAHDKEVYDIAFAPSTDVFASAGADGSIRMFDLRSLEHSTIIYESIDLIPLLRLVWNRHDSNYLSTFAMEQNSVIILDIRSPSIPVAELTGHSAPINSISWAPHSSCHICTASDDYSALIWDLTNIPKQITEPILAYNAEGEINTLQWSINQPEWVAITFKKKLQILRV